MRFFATLSVVPRPDATYLALMGLTLATYLVFQDVPAVLFGTTVAPLKLAIAVFLIGSISRNLILNRALWQRSSGRTAGILASVLTPVALIWLLGSVSLFAVQLAFSIWVLAYALFVTAILRWDPDYIPNIPSVWARDRFAVPALSLVAIGDAAFATTLAGIALFGTELTWIAVMTLGAVGTKFFVNWIIVLMIIVRLDEGD